MSDEAYTQQEAKMVIYICDFYKFILPLFMYMESKGIQTICTLCNDWKMTIILDDPLHKGVRVTILCSTFEKHAPVSLKIVR